MSDFLDALGLLLIIEGAFYALFTKQAITMLKQIQAMPPNRLRGAGALATLIGFVVIWAVRG